MTAAPDQSPDDTTLLTIEDIERPLTENHAVLWTVVIVSTVFDILTTMVGLNLGFHEGNAVARAFIQTYGTPGIGLLKFVALVGMVIGWGTLSDRRATALLAGFAVASLVVVVLNALTLASV
ncbi:MAG: DUF5658 family protein [Halobacteriales archaeon]